MWKYGENPTVEEVNRKIEYVELLIRKVGGKKTDLGLYRKQNLENRDIYEYSGVYYRVNFIPSDEKPLIVIEYAEDENSAAQGVMWDIEPFPYDLPDDKIMKEVNFALGIEPYPKDYPNG